MFWSIPNTYPPASSSFQFPLHGETTQMGNNPYCPVASRSIAASRSPTKSVFILPGAVTKISPVVGFCTLYLTTCSCPAIHPPSSLFHWHIPLALYPGLPGELLRLFTVLARRAGLSTGEMGCRHASNSLVLVPTQLSSWGGWTSSHKEGALPHYLQAVVPVCLPSNPKPTAGRARRKNKGLVVFPKHFSHSLPILNSVPALWSHLPQFGSCVFRVTPQKEVLAWAPGQSGWVACRSPCASSASPAVSCMYKSHITGHFSNSE